MGNYSEEKKNFFKKILDNKVGLCLFFIAFSVIIDVFGFKLLPRLLVWIMNSVFGLKNAIRTWIVYLVLYVIISIPCLVFIYLVKNKRSDKKTDFRFVLDLIFIIEFFVVFSYMINLSYLVLDKIKFYVSIESEFWFFILSIFSICYILNSTIKNFWKINYSFIFSLVFFTFLSGSITIEKFLIVTLIVSIVNIFFSDVILLYKNSYRSINKNNNLNYDSIIENRTEEKNSSRKLSFNIGIFILYIYLVIIENDRLGLLQFLANILNIPVFNVGALPTSASLYCFDNTIKESKFMLFFNEFTKISYIGILRIILIIIILLTLVLVLAIWLIINKCRKKSSFGKEYNEFINKIKTNYMNFIRKFIYYKKYVDIKKHKSIKTNIKTSVHINSRKKSHRIYKYKNIEFHNKKPNSN